jgi:hypothetical protein
MAEEVSREGREETHITNCGFPGFEIFVIRGLLLHSLPPRFFPWFTFLRKKCDHRALQLRFLVK